jgi:dihydrofolate reductase
MEYARRIVTFDCVSADGYFAGPEGNLDWVVPDKEQAKVAAQEIPKFDTALFGRRTYELFAAFWPDAVVDASGTVPDPHNPGRRSSEQAPVATALNSMTKRVCSRTLNEVTWKNSRPVRELDLHQIAAIKKQPGKDMIVFGSGSIGSQLTQHGLIDEYQFTVCPIFIGSGQHLLKGVSTRVQLELLEVKPLRSGDVLLRYARRLI